ncbi:hypothetical protein QJQ45_005789 [Haematococcus lacustris]|nr:hypothetical protein QJQ45_005789 [Haematococcus lacustris]
MKSSVKRSSRGRREISGGEPDIERDSPQRSRPSTRVNPIAHRWNIVPCLLFLIFLGSAAYYFVIRFQGLAIGGWQPYPLFIRLGLVVNYWATFAMQICLELVGQTAFLPYAILLLRSVYPTGSLGLPPGTDREASTAAVAGMTPRTDQSATDCRTVYLCDDGKDAEKQAFIEALSATEDVVYVSGRTRKKGEVNGKSANLNFCLHSIYASLPRSELNPENVDWSEISNKELVVVFDSDMCAKPDFFCKARGSSTSQPPGSPQLPQFIFEVMLDDNLALCLTPQAFHNIDPDTDLFNSINVQFWEYWLPGAFAWGYIACTGTNFCIRARALAHCGWFPEYTITEDYALGMELKSRGYKATYLNDYIAVGEVRTTAAPDAPPCTACTVFASHQQAAGTPCLGSGQPLHLTAYLQAPEEIRNVFRQRSRWTKGHFQVFFSAKCPLLNFELPFFQRLWYSYAAWAPITTILTVPAFIIVPFMSIAFGIHPVTITYELVLASTLYFISQNSLQYYVHTLKHLKLMWFVNVSNTVLWFTFTKAFVNTMAAKLGFKAIMFKVTDKTKGESGNKPALPAPAPAKDGEVEKIVSASMQPTGNSLARMSHRLATAVYNSFTRPPAPAQPVQAKSRLANASGDTGPNGAAGDEELQPHVQSWLHRNAAEAHQPRSRNASLTSASDDTPRYASSVYSGSSVRRARQPSNDPARIAAAAGYASSKRPDVPAPSARPAPAPVQSWTTTAASHNLSRRPEASGSQTVVSYREALPMMASFAGVGGADDRTLTAPAAAACELVVVVEGSGMPAPPDAPDMPDAAPLPPNEFHESMAAVQQSDAPLRQPTADSQAMPGSGQYMAHSAAAVAYNQGLLSQSTSRLSSPQVDAVSEQVRALPAIATRPVFVSPAPIHVVPVYVNAAGQSQRESQQQRLPAPWEMGAWEDQLAKKVLEHIKEKGPLSSDWALRKSRVKKDEGKSRPGERLARLKTVMASFKPANVQDFGKMFDPLALLFLWLFCLVISLVGMWELSQTIARDTLTSFALNSPLTGNPYLMIAICWFVTKWLPGISTMVLLGSIVLLWLLIPTEFDVQAPLSMALQTFLPNQIMRDTNMGVVLVTGLAAVPLSLPALLSRGPSEPLPLLNATLASAAIPSSHLEVADLVASVNLLGGLTPGVDPVKYAQPSAYTLTMLAWSLLQFPDGFTHQQAAAAKQTLRQVDKLQSMAKLLLGADYLMRSNLNPADSRNPVFVAQLGDPNRYVLDSHPGYYPASEGKVWTSTAQDPALTGALARPAWVMTRENPGADLLTGAAAALSAASMALRRDDAAWSDLSLAHARYLYSFGISNSLDPKSACASMPCTTDIIVEEQVTAVPLVSDYDGTPKCYWADWNAKTCRVAYTSSQCDTLRSSISDVFTNKQGCCDMFVAAKVWSITYTGAQGICALPENQTTCYVPDRTQRTCYEQTVDLETGVGCSGVGIEVFPTTLGCCTYLNTLGIVATTVTATGQVSYGQGLCARVGTDPSFRKCYVPSIINSTCMELAGPACAQYGGETSFDEPIGCCNRLVSMLATVSIVRPIVMTGVCTRGGAPTSSQSLATATGKRLRRGLQSSLGQGSVKQLWSGLTAYMADTVASLAPSGPARRRLMQTATPASAGMTPVANNQPLAQSQLQSLSLANLLASLIGSPARGFGSGGASGSSLPALLSSLLGGGKASVANATQWPLPKASAVLEYDPCAAGTCRIMTVNRTKTVPFFNSTTVLDDMAWGAVWMYKATREPQYLGQAELFMKRHKQGLRVLLAVLVWLQEEMAADSLQFTRQYYVPDWNNVAWATDVLLANITDSNVYHGRLRTLLATWSYADSLPTAPTQPSQIKARTNPLFNLQNFTDATTNSSYAIVPECRPTALYEVNCYDGIDDDCNGLVDKEDTACGLFPTLYTPRQIAFSSSPSLPNAASAAFLAMAYSDQVSAAASIQLRCWALSQAGHMLGTGVGENSYIVGYGTNPPTIVQHRDSSCPAG